MSERNREFFKKYEDSKYMKPSATVDMVIFTAVDGDDDDRRRLPDKILQILLVKRKGDHLITEEKDPYQGKWALPGGFVNYYESIDDAAVRELKGETNVDNVYMEQLYTWGEVFRDLRRRVISTSYMALVDSTKLNVKAGDDAEDARWFNVHLKVIREVKTPTEKGYVLEKTYELNLVGTDDLIRNQIIVTKTVEGHISKKEYKLIEDENGLAFDHAGIIQYALERLKNKVEYTDIAFSLMPEYFTLAELQKVYEVLLGKEIGEANFRTKVTKTRKLVVETKKISQKIKQFRPSKLFKFNPDWEEQS